MIPPEGAGSTGVSLRPGDLEMFRRLGILPDLLAEARIERVTDTVARQKYGITGLATECMDGILFPCFSPETDYRNSAKVRRDHPEMDGEGKPLKKYAAAWGDPRRFYYSPGAKEMLEDVSVPIAYVESEKAVLALTAWARRQRRRLLVAGMSGCWGWRTIKRKRNEKGKLVDVHEELFDLNYCAGREVYVLLDANVAENTKVQAAEKAFITALRKRNSKVRRCRLPKIEGVNGPDDFIAVAGDEAMAKVLDGVRTTTQRGQPNGQCAAGETPDTHDVTSTTEFSEDALALEFTARYKDDLRYTAAWGRWYMWNKTHWHEDVVLNVYDRARAVCREEALRCPLPAAAKQLTSARTRAAVENLARADPRHAAVIEQWDGNEWLLNTPGGTIDLATGQIRKAQRNDYITRSTAVAPDKNHPTPQWNAFLKCITGNDEALVAYLQRIAGYSLTGSIRERAMFFLYGTGTNGKSTLIRTFSGILGDGYARTAPIEAFVESQGYRHPTELAMLRGARFVSAIETEEGRHWAESKLKALTGGDMISTRFMRQDFFEFTPSFKLIIAGNHKPSLRSVDEAIRARIRIVPFLVTIPPDQLDLNLGNKLRGEWPGILAWMVEGCKLYLRNGLIAPESVTDATSSYFESEDALGRWIEDRLAEAPQAFSSSSMLYANWQSWAMAAGEHVGTMKALVTALGDRFRAMGWRAKHGRNGSGPSGFFGVTTKG